MIRQIVGFLGVFAGLMLAAPGLATAAAVSPPQSVIRDSGRQVLVLLRLPPAHIRANSDYGGSYGDGAGRAARHRIAEAIARAHGLTLVDDWPMPLLGLDCFVMAVPADRSVPEAVDALSKDSGVEWSQPVNVFHAQGSPPIPNDPLFRIQPAAAAWHLADLHQIATGKGVVVAVIDSQIDLKQPDLIDQVQLSQNFVAGQADVPETHGTGVAGIIAARDNNGIGIAGIAPHARLLALRACWQTPIDQTDVTGTICDSLSLAKALHYAIDHNAQVINLSLSGPPDLLLAKLLDVGFARGSIVVAAFDRSLPRGGFPASHPGVIAVTDDALFATKVGIYSAPGHDVPTTQPGGHWFLVNGSSYAAAHVSGLYALLREQWPARKDPVNLVSAVPGSGAIDSCATMLRMRGTCDCACPVAGEFSVGLRN